MSKVGGGRNYGYGKQLRWAAKNALSDRYGAGHYGTRASHEARWMPFVHFLKSEFGIKDARDIDKTPIAAYVKYLAQQVQSQTMKVAYAQNLLSTVNVVLSTMRKDTMLSVSPASAVGERTHVRSEVPKTLSQPSRMLDQSVNGANNNHLDLAIKRLVGKGEHPLALTASLCRTFGLRFREASLLNARVALRQASLHGKINITQGTKGGRGKQIDRWVPVSRRGLALLKKVLSEQGQSQNLIPDQHNYIQWRNHAYSQWRVATQDTEIRGFHDLRAAYACERYQQITQQMAPVVSGGRTVNKRLDLEARSIIAVELGHSRVNVLVSYIGSSR